MHSKKLKGILRQQLGEIPYAITELMSRSLLNWNWKVQPEQKLSIEFADACRKATLEGRLKAVWCHVANEGQRHAITALILKAMGLLPGALDYWFISETGGCLIEFKNPDEPLPDDFKNNQKNFSLWAQSLNVPCYLHNTVSGALQSLREGGLLI